MNNQMNKWYETSFRRNLVDMHIDDWNEEFFSQFDPQQYFDCLKKGHIQSPMIYLQSHVGLCNWPTQSGKMHSGFQGKNKVKQLIDLCHAEGMDVVGYYSLIYNNWAYEKYPQWRMKDREGHHSRDNKDHGFSGGRYGILCPNNLQYREFVLTQLAEILNTYKIEGIFLDMTFWPMICYCDECQKRFRTETGYHIPKTIDWSNAVWQQFQLKREQWLNEFAAVCSAELKRLLPEISIEHQFSTMHQHWVYGVNEGINKASDYAGGDLYGGHYQESFVCKLYYEITKNQPFEYMTSRCDPDILDHTTTKSIEALRLHNFLTLAHHGAMLFIDAIDPNGTINPKVYDTIGKVFEESIPYEKYLTGKMVADTAIYFNLESKMNSRAKGNQIDYSNPQLDATVGAAMALTSNNFLYTVIPSNKQDRIIDKKVVVVSEAAFLSDEEIDNFADYVKRGGSLYISGSTESRLAKKLLGLELLGYTEENITYIAPTNEGQSLFGEMYTNEHPLAYKDVQMKVANTLGKKVLATITLPYTNPDDKTKFAAIHSNPPGIKTDMPAIVYGEYGKGKVIWSAASFEKNPQKAHKDVFICMIRLLYGSSSMFSTSAPYFVQFTLFDDNKNNCKYLNVINVQEQVPLIKIDNFKIKLLSDKAIQSVLLLPDEIVVDYTYTNGILEFDVIDIDIFKMYKIKY